MVVSSMVPGFRPKARRNDISGMPSGRRRVESLLVFSQIPGFSNFDKLIVPKGTE